MKNESDEEREQRKARKAANRKVKSEATSGDEGLSTPLGGGGGGGTDGEPKKKRRKLKKSGAASAAASTQPSDAEEGGALFSEGEEEKPLKKVPVFPPLVSLGTFAYGVPVELTSVGRRGSVLHVRRMKSQPLHPEKNSSKFLSLTRSIFTAMLNVPLFFFS